MRDWKTNLAFAWVAQFICLLGFNAALPFLPFYIRDLGVTNESQLALWSGIMTAAGPLAIAITAPIWGVLADRHGRKLMAARAALAQGLALGLMALAGNVHQLFVLRVIQGAFAGVIPAVTALVAAFTPASEMGFALGMIQMSAYGGMSIGPLLGGFVADHLGYHWVFGITGILLALGGVIIVFFVQERFTPPTAEERQRTSLGAAMGTVVRSMPVLGAVVVMAGIYAADAAPRPILPLFVEQLRQDATLVNTSTGLFYGVVALAVALAGAVVGRLSDRMSYRKVILACVLGAALGYAGQAVSPTFVVLMGTGFFTGLCIGGLLPAANALLARGVPREQQGAIYGISASMSQLGAAAGPMLGAGLATALTFRAAFAGAAAVALLLALGVGVLVKPEVRRLAVRQGDSSDLAR